MKVAFVHEFLTQFGGAERVLLALLEIFPDAPVYTMIYNKEKTGSYFSKYNIRTSYLQNMPLAKEKSRWYLALMPNAIESFNLSQYDLVLSDASAFAKGVKTNKNTYHICYCHTPTRYLWSDRETYLKSQNIPWPVHMIVPLVLDILKKWDYKAAQRPDRMIANSNYIKARIKKYYNRDADVIYPFVDDDKFTKPSKKEDYYLIAGRLVPYKRYDIAIEAFNKMPDKKLYVAGSNILAGSGAKYTKLEEMATSKNIKFLGRVSDEKLASLYKKAKAYIFPSEEDFGITPLEAMAAGTPVIAYNAGGAKETVIQGKTGVFFNKQNSESLLEAIDKFETMDFEYTNLINQAKKFSKDNFKKNIINYIKKYKGESWN